jgi:alkylated DNA repair dioxygenase AlkB
MDNISYSLDLLSEDEATMQFDALRHQTPWRQYKGGFGKPRPRLEAWYGDAGARYASYNHGMEPLPWTPTLLSLRAKVSEATGATFNGVLLNLYRTERDSVDWHADDEPEFGREPVIASVSLYEYPVTDSEARRFVLRHTSTGRKQTIHLAHGSLLVMAGDTQAQYEHSVPKETSPRPERINLTFRRIITPEGNPPVCIRTGSQ